MSEKVSVVVPVYKVEKYLNRCVNSILNQTYTNLEIILVNDGSPDYCGEMIDSYAAKDSRIITVHKENGGLSDARNAGMEHVTGNYTMFVDSDDWLEVAMIEKLMNAITKYQADVVQSAFYYAYEEYLLYDNRYYSIKDSPVILNNKSLMFELVKNEKVKNFAWGKLYKTELIKDLPFKKGVLFEDVFWAHIVMQRVNTYVILHQPLYYYLQRKDSIVAMYTSRNLDILRGLKVRHKFIEQYYPELINESLKTILRTSIIHYNFLLLNWKKDKLGLHKNEIYSYIKNNYIQFTMAVKGDKQVEKQLKLFIFHPYLNISYLIFKRVLRRLNILPRPLGMKRVQPLNTSGVPKWRKS
ncbi:glycosyltransferase involved in cell wall biosynthesis [Cytobacillus firmus]|uniref:Glycosyltransferase involved in cell wall biosynthesis n=3 Tax=Cytobacillus TaxID=2675230 RepID=A0A366JMY1_CYTFI|nr:MULTISPECIES: glycosyltransferase [Cytobacillus]AND41926.1 beta-1,4-galactosyltransferase [Cytobacillus oceanisediminis 2691]RBP88273.1 glycosyltransferase involved in cell wall biosynthesis [Cytobacillus firmus]TDX38346.1 glycosyltransferase involved in cell wall biosynthesis [Cytobacillus oceanisediminis]